MILVISTCKYFFSEEEFVRPIVEIIRRLGLTCHIKKYNEELDFDKYSKIIICGTAIRDFDYLNYINNFSSLIRYNGKVLGICAGYQILARIYQNRLENIEKIGIHKVKVLKHSPLTDKEEFYAYFLHVYALSNVNENLVALARQNNEICIFKVKNKDFYGVSFHPEVLNKEIIYNLLLL